MELKKDIDKEKLGKIVALAKHGIGGEKENAIRIVKRLCSQHDLNFDDVMNDTNIEKHILEIKKGDIQLAIQIIARYAKMSMGGDVMVSRDGRSILFETTKEKYIETVNAYSILSHKYREEKKILVASFESAFFSKHNLFYQPTDKERAEILEKRLMEEKKKTKAQREREEKERRTAIAIMANLDDVQIRKQLK